jgi:uncharacterized CHY-type Zn-finger protein
MHKNIFCSSCEADFTIRHDMNDDYYRVEHCPFCGDTLEGDTDYEYDIEEEEE